MSVTITFRDIISVEADSRGLIVNKSKNDIDIENYMPFISCYHTCTTVVPYK